MPVANTHWCGKIGLAVGIWAAVLAGAAAQESPEEDTPAMPIGSEAKAVDDQLLGTPGGGSDGGPPRPGEEPTGQGGADPVVNPAAAPRAGPTTQPTAGPANAGTFRAGTPQPATSAPAVTHAPAVQPGAGATELTPEIKQNRGLKQ